jgi:hypothetical protein
MTQKKKFLNTFPIAAMILTAIAPALPAAASPTNPNNGFTFVQVSGITLVSGEGTFANSWRAELSGKIATFAIEHTSGVTACAIPMINPNYVSISIASNRCEVAVDLSDPIIVGDVGANLNVTPTVGSVSTIGLFLAPGAGTSANASDTPTPAKYSGPEFSGLSGMGIMTGSTGKLEGKRLDQISSIEIGGNAATFTATSATELELSLPAGLAPGLYDLVINSSAGKLTHINAIQVREPKQSFSITTRSTGKISEEQYLEHSLIAAMQAPELNKARCIVNASTQAMAEAMAKRLCAIVKASNPNIETTVVVSRSTVKNDTVFARVIYGWN